MIHDLDSFRDIAWQTLEKPGDASLRAQIEAALNEHPEWVSEWKDLRETYALAREAVPAAVAREEVEPSNEIPPARLESLMQSIAQAQRKPAAHTPHSIQRRPSGRVWNWLGAAAAIALVSSVAWFWLEARQRDRFDVSPWLLHASPELAHSLTAPLETLVARANLPTLRADEGIYLRSPILATAAGEVVVSWNGPSNITVSLKERNRTLWTIANAQSPVSTPPLPAGETYEVVLTDGTTTVREPFVTVYTITAQPGLPGVLDAIVSEPARLGDAVRLWRSLPEKERHRELGIRLGLWLGVQARQPDMLEEAKQAAAAFER